MAQQDSTTFIDQLERTPDRGVPAAAATNGVCC